MVSNNGLVKFIRQCARTDCDFEAQWTPVLLIPSPRDKPTQVRGRLVIEKHDVCQSHKEELRVVDFLGAVGWDMLKWKINVMGKTPPKEEDLVLEWQKVFV